MSKNKEKAPKSAKVKTPTNKRTKAMFIKILAGLVCVVIVCTTVNVAIDKVTKKISDSPAQPTGGNQQVNVDPNNGYINSNPSVNPGVPSGTDTPNVQNPANPQTPTPNVTPNVTPNGNGNAVQPPVNNSDPLKFNKAQIIDYYNKCLTNAYSQPRFNVTKTEKVDVKLGEMRLNGKPTDKLQSMANGVVAKNAKDKKDSQSFTNKTAVVDAQKRFILPARLSSAGAKSATIAKNGAGYVITITLVPESCDFRTKPPYNSACTFPLDFTEIDLGSLGQITSAQFYYPGTTLTATIDGSGRVVQTKVVMPLTVDDASGVGMGQQLNMDISGYWYCTTINQF